MAAAPMHYHVSMAHTGPETKDVGAFQFRDTALELFRDVDAHLTAKGFRRDPAWGFVMTATGREGARFIRERRRRFSGKDEYLGTALVYELRGCDRADCQLFDPELEEARQEAWGVEYNRYAELRAEFFAEHELVHAHQEEINQWHLWRADAVKHAAQVYSRRCEDLRCTYEAYPLLLANLERNADYRYPSPTHQGAGTLLADAFLE